jgi:YidC/Oxa1 family membrane protein insertase
MEKRVILAFVLSIAVMYVFTSLYTPRKAPEPATGVQTTGSAPATQTPTASTPITSNTVAENTQSASSTPEQESRADKPEDFVLDTPLYTAIISNVGGVLKSYRLKAYSDAEGHPLELIDQPAASKVGWPLTVTTGDKAVDEELSGAQFIGHQDGDRLSLDYASKGLSVRKTFEFDRENYEFSLQAAVTKAGKNIPFGVAWRGGFGDQSIPQDPAKKNAVYQTDSAFKRVNLRGLKDQEQTYTTVRAGIDDQYFMAMFLLPDNPVQVKIRKLEFPAPDGKTQIATLSETVPVSEGKPIHVYVGPKQRDSLGKADPVLPSVVDYGYFEFIAKPLVFCLLWIHSYIGNFGWAIILLTIALNVVLFPLRLKQQVSMLKMQKIQPQMRRLQDQYKKLKATDPRRPQVQADMMNLYKEHGVNPMGGCLPLVLQMPLLFGFYSALSYSIELRRAPWLLWVKDLSQPDYIIHNIPILAILMAISMFIQQRLTPTTNVDPAQAKMMMVMPLMFTFMFWSQSSGLVLYWLTSNVIGIIQQIFINKYWSPHAESKLARTKAKEIRET